MSAKTSTHHAFAIQVKYVLYAEPSKVFDALTLEGMISGWCDDGGKVGAGSGDPVEMFGDWVKGEVVINDKKKLKLSYTWKPAEWDKKTPVSQVSFEFKKHPAGTEVTVEHSGFPNQKEADNHRKGWVDYVFEPMNDFLVDSRQS